MSDQPSTSWQNAEESDEFDKKPNITKTKRNKRSELLLKLSKEREKNVEEDNKLEINENLELIKEFSKKISITKDNSNAQNKAHTHVEDDSQMHVEHYDQTHIDINKQTHDENDVHNYVENHAQEYTETNSLVRTENEIREELRANERRINSMRDGETAPVTREFILHAMSSLLENSYVNIGIGQVVKRRGMVTYQVIFEMTKMSKKHCKLCFVLGHKLFKCPTFLTQSVQIRIYFLNRLKLCYKCFSRHRKGGCKLKKNCPICNKKHNKLVCQAYERILSYREEDWD